jgi:nitrogen fixation protein NifQ
MNGPDRLPCRTVVLAELLATPAASSIASDPNRLLLASMIAGRAAATSCLPTHLGLGLHTYAAMLADYFPSFENTAQADTAGTIPEWSDLQTLLLDNRANTHDSERWMADIIATACVGRDHLWQDLGLANRAELSQLMCLNFPALARANTGDMKWKKFLYKQFCAREGIFVCPAPSCSECKDFAKCFGPEN